MGLRFNFNPRPREEGDLCYRLQEPAGAISIHALVKRATVDILTAGDVPEISIHALVKRATKGDTIPKQYLDISIHALVKRATSGTQAES